MINYVNSHNLRPTSRESVNRFAVRPEPAELVPVAVVSPELIQAFSMQPAVVAGIVVPSEPEPESGLKNASAEVFRKSFCDQLKTAGRYNPRGIKRWVILAIESGKPVQLTAVDSEGIVRSEVDTIGETAGCARVIVSEKSLATVAGKLKTDFLMIHLDERTEIQTDSKGNKKTVPVCSVRIVSGESEFCLPAESVDGFPEIESGTAFHAVKNWTDKPFGATFAQTVSAADVIESIRRVEYASDAESTRYALAGICLEFNVDQITFAATDACRLSIVEQPAGILGTMPEDFSATAHVLPAVMVQQLSELAKRIPADSPICFAYSGTEFVIESAGFSIRCLMLEGRFPRFRQIVPTSSSVQITFSRKELIESIESAAVVRTDDCRGIDFRFYANESGELTGTSLHCESPELGKSNVPVNCRPSGNMSDRHLKNDSGEITERGESESFDVKYVLEFLKSTKTDCVHLAMNAAGMPAVFTDDSGLNAKYILMPLSRD